MLTIFPLSIFVSCYSRGFQQGQAEHIQIMKAQTNRPRNQLFLMQCLLVQPELALEQTFKDFFVSQFGGGTRCVVDIPVSNISIDQANQQFRQCAFI